MFSLVLFVSVFCLLCGFNCASSGANKDLGLNLVFFHMRKAGGSMLRSLLDDWLARQGCNGGTSLGRFGMERGRMIRENGTMDGLSKCHDLTIMISEYGLVNAHNVLSVGAPMGSRKSPLKLLTMLRHPIRRVISQAFYNGFGTDIIRKYAVERCAFTNDKWRFNTAAATCNTARREKRKDLDAVPNGGGSSGSLNCTCFIDSEVAARQFIRTDEAGWRAWLDPALSGFGDQYMSNYYVKRLASFKRTYAYSKKTVPGAGFVPASRALLHDVWGDTLQPGADEVIANPVHKMTLVDSNFHALREAFHVHGASEAPMASWEMLDSAKKLIDQHFDTLILELFNDVSAWRLLNEVLGGVPLPESAGPAKVNAGLFEKAGLVHTSFTTSHRRTTDILDVEEFALGFMPPAILSMLQKLNKIDLNLYAHAVGIYQERIAAKISVNDATLAVATHSTGAAASGRPVMSTSCRQLRASMGLSDDPTEVFASSLELPNILSEMKNTKREYLSIPQAGSVTVHKSLRERHVESKLFSYGNCSASKFNKYCGVNMGCKCNSWHTPPRYLPRDMFAGFTSWSIARNPVDRAFAQYKVWAGKVGSEAPSADAYFAFLLQSLQQRPYLHDCHNVAQYEYIWRADGTKSIDIVLRFEDPGIKDSLRLLLAGIEHESLGDADDGGLVAVKLPLSAAHPAKTLSSHSALRGASDGFVLSRDLKKRLESYFWKDMCLLGYDISAEPSGDSGKAGTFGFGFWGPDREPTHSKNSNPVATEYTNPNDNCG